MQMTMGVQTMKENSSSEQMTTMEQEEKKTFVITGEYLSSVANLCHRWMVCVISWEYVITVQ